MIFETICTAVICLSQPIAVHDGDSFRADGMAFRIFGISAPERYAPGGLAAKQALQAIIADQPLACTPRGASYNRIVVECILPDGTDLACAMVEAGHATDWPEFSGGRYEDCARPMARDR